MDPEASSAPVPQRLPFPPVTYSHILHCSYHYWHPLYRSITPKARTIPLTGPFVSYLRADGIVLPPEDTPPSEDDDLDSFSGSDEEAPDPSTEWKEIHSRIQSTIAEFGGKVTPKLNWSAPKDAAFMSATNDLQCRTANDIYLLLKSSDFITHDLEHPFDGCVSDEEAAAATALDTQLVRATPKPEIPYHLVLRKYVNFNPSLEFRCFVRNNVLLCICQRDQNHFDFLFPMRDTLRARIQAFFDKKLKDTFPDPNFAFDVYIPPPHQRVWLVDVNPWAERTDPLLFSWLEILRMKDPVGVTEEGETGDPDTPEGQFVRLSLNRNNLCSEEPSETSESEGDNDNNDEEEAAPLFAEFRLVKRDDPEAYAFTTSQYSAHKLPREVVDASIAGPGGMREFMEQWQDILARRAQEDQESDNE